MKKLAVYTICILLLIGAMLSILSNTAIASPSADQDLPIITGTVKSGISKRTGPAPLSVPPVQFVLNASCFDTSSEPPQPSTYYQVGPTTEGDTWEMYTQIWAAGGYGDDDFTMNPTTADWWWRKTWWLTWDRPPKALNMTSVYTVAATGNVYSATFFKRCPEIVVDGDLWSNSPVTLTAVNSGAVPTYTWSFGDGQVGTGNPISHIYHDIGVHTIAVTGTLDAYDPVTNTLTITLTRKPVKLFLPWVSVSPPPIIKR